MDNTIKKAISQAKPMLMKALNNIIEDGVVEEELDSVMEILEGLHHMYDLEKVMDGEAGGGVGGGGKSGL